MNPLSFTQARVGASILDADKIIQSYLQENDPLARLKGVQTNLRRAGFYNQVPNGVADDAYRNALHAFQQATGIPISDNASDQTLIRLAGYLSALQNNPPPAPRPLAMDPRVADAQAALANLHFYQGPISGYPNELYYTALKAFQAGFLLGIPGNLNPIPVLDDPTLSMLYQTSKLPAGQGFATATAAAAATAAANVAQMPASAVTANRPDSDGFSADAVNAVASSTAKQAGVVALMTAPLWGYALYAHFVR